ncbi:MAG: hypothetical protein AB1324_07380 [Candidatus Micrarchaeota archaeon]
MALRKKTVKPPKKTSKKALIPQKKAKAKPAKKPEPTKAAEREASILRAKEEQLFGQRVAKILSDSHVRQNLIGIGGENALAIVRNFYGNHSDEEIAKKLKIKISDVRATLNKLHNEGLVNYIREKDSETGWYSYSWSLNQDRMEKWATSQGSRLDALGGGNAEFYFCPSCGSSSITNFESAASADFRCDRCNRMLEFIDEKKLNELHEKEKL